METIQEASEESEEILARVKFPDWLYWRSGKIQEDSNGIRTFYYQMARRQIKSKPIVSGTLIKTMDRK